MAKFLPWFATKHGKYFTRTCIGIAAVSAFGSHIAIHGPCLDKWRELIQLYRFGKERCLSSNVQRLVEEVLKESKLKSEEKEKLKFFNVIGLDLYHAGGTNSPWGAMIGIPFTFEDPQNINFGDMRIMGRDSIDWVIDGQDLLEALIISDNAKKFALMKEIYSCDFWNVLKKAVVSASCILIPAVFVSRVNVKKNAFQTSTLRTRISFYVFSYMFGFILYSFLKDREKYVTDKECDRLAAETGPEYLNGGIEFYEKLLMRNKALRDLMRSRSKKEIGDGNYWLFMPGLPISKRLELLKDMKIEREKEFKMS